MVGVVVRVREQTAVPLVGRQGGARASVLRRSVVVLVLLAGRRALRAGW